MAVLNLKHPITFGKITIDKLNFRDYTVAGDYLSFDQRGGVAQRIALISSLTGSDEELIKNLRGPDYRKAEALADAMMDADEKEFAAGESQEKKPSAS